MAKNKNKCIVSAALKKAERRARLQAMADSGGRRAQRAVTFAGADRKGKAAARGRSYRGEW